MVSPAPHSRPPRAAPALAVVLATILFSGVPASAQAPPERPTRVAVAANMQRAFEEILPGFRRATGLDVQPIYGSTGQFRRQIAQGAPFDVFLSADEDTVIALAAEGLTADAGVVYAVGRLAIFAPNGSPLRPDAALRGLRELLEAGRVTRFAIANPEVAPYGRAAVEALRRAGLLDAIRPRLVTGENIAQAAQFAASGSAEGGLVALSLVIVPPLSERGTHAVVPADWHAPIAQRMALVAGGGRGASEAARRLLAFLQGPEAHAVLEAHGYTVPGDGATPRPAPAPPASASPSPAPR